MSGPTRARRVTLASVVLMLLCLIGTPVLAQAGPVTSSGDAVADALARAAANDKGSPKWTATKELTRSFVNADGSMYEFPTNTVTVSADQTRNLRGRQRVHISWKGAQPSGGRASNPFGEKGLAQEYPVVVMQCRGVDDPSAPAAKRLSPQTCWTVSVAQRSQLSTTEFDALWTRDLKAPATERERLSSAAGTLPDAKTCPTFDQGEFFSHLTPFKSAKGTAYQACSADTMPPEAALDAAFPANEIAAFTKTDGSGEVQFEVRSDAENESLGCNSKTACAIVVVPINGLSCVQPSTPMTDADRACRLGGQFEPGSSNFSGQGVDTAVSPALWWSASNWQNRFTIPITFGLPPDTCEVLDSRAPTGFYGSELLAQASLQWAPAYCLDKKRFKFQHNQMSDEAGWNLMESGGGAAAVVSSAHPKKGEDPVAYAPTAVTGFSIGYVIDRPGNAGEVADLRLNARLLAKLMTQSYVASDLGRGHPGMAKNPVGLMSDPEFIALNPGLSRIDQEAGATLLNLSNSSDVIDQLTRYLATDEAAMRWIDGKPDKWGMKVNPSYRKIKLPRSEWPLLDSYIPKTQNSCRQKNPAVYFTQVAAPVTNLRKIAEALLDGWPNVQTKCDYDPATDTYKVGRVGQQSYGARFMLGVVSLGDAARYGLHNAALQTTGNSYVRPTDSSLADAVALSTREKGSYAPFTLDQAVVRTQKKAYPGMMVAYTAARTRNLAAADATKVAQFIRTATVEGQRPGSGNGQLPEGFLPIRRTGVTAKLFTAAQEAAAAIEKQAPGKATPDTGGPGGAGDSKGSTGVDEAPSATDDVPTLEKTTAPVPAPKPAVDGPVQTAPTAAVSSSVAARALPGLLAVGVLGVLVAGCTRFLVRPARSRPGGTGGGPR